MRTITLDLTKEELAYLKKIAKEKDTFLDDVVQEILEEYLEKNKSS